MATGRDGYAGDGYSAWTWWERRRPLYNLALIAAGAAGFAIQAAAAARISDAPVDLVYFGLWRGVLYAVYMVMANLFYLLGPVIEAMVNPAPLGDYRRDAFFMGLFASVLLPLIISLAMAVAMLRPLNVA